jgi:CubicO group peptidase (beta-lactamase class C family)
MDGVMDEGQAGGGEREAGRYNPRVTKSAFSTAMCGIAVVVLSSGFRGASTAQSPQRPPRGAATAPAPSQYFPDRFDWLRREPAQAGMDPARLDAAIKFAIGRENPATKDLAVDLATTFGAREPYDNAIGPVKARGALNGVVVRNGYLVAEWGDTTRVDMTFSVTKTFLSTVVGLAWQKGLIRDVNDRVGDYVPGTGLFESEHNAKITWDHLLRQTSDWQGTLWGKPDWADRPEGKTAADWPNRPLNEPGTRYKYNDVRVNVLALAALHVLRRPLPEVLRAEVMEPIGASSTWRWHGYENSWIELDGQRMQSMTGGGHWGGGMFISARDMARFGYLFLRKGTWKDKAIVSPKWIEMARTPGVNRTYGYMNWFLNTERKPFPNAPASAVTFQGNGSNIIYVDWENDLVVVVRWIQQSAFNEFIGQVLGSLTTTSTPSASR